MESRARTRSRSPCTPPTPSRARSCRHRSERLVRWRADASFARSDTRRWRRGRCTQDSVDVGTLARAALALGWDGLYCLPGTADPWGDKAARAARGAAWRLPVRGGASSSRGGGSGGSGGGASWGELLEVARAAGLDFMVAEPREEEEGGWDEKKPPDASSKKNPKERGAGAGGGVCLVLGSEGSGLSAEGRAALASYSSRGGGGGKVSSVSIPMTGEMESLNVATAGAVLMFALSEGAGDFVRKLEER